MSNHVVSCQMQCEGINEKDRWSRIEKEIIIRVISNAGYNEV